MRTSIAGEKDTRAGAVSLAVSVDRDRGSTAAHLA